MLEKSQPIPPATRPTTPALGPIHVPRADASDRSTRYRHAHPSPPPSRRRCQNRKICELSLARSIQLLAALSRRSVAEAGLGMRYAT
jgi:hypothetical protein